MTMGSGAPVWIRPPEVLAPEVLADEVEVTE